MAAARKRKHTVRQSGGERRPSEHVGIQAKPGNPRTPVARGGRGTKAHARPARAASAKKGAGASKGTDRSRHRTQGGKKTRTSLSPSIR